MTQPMRKKDERAESVKLFRNIMQGDFAEVLENCIQRLIEVELRARWEQSPISVQSNVLPTAMTTVSAKSLSAPDWRISISIPKLRNGSFYPSILEQSQRVDRALISSIGEAYFAGVSTRKMNKLFAELGLSNIDRSCVSRGAAQIDEEVEI